MYKILDRRIVSQETNRPVEIENFAEDQNNSRDLGIEILNYASPVVQISLSDTSDFQVKIHAESDGFRATFRSNEELVYDHLVDGSYAFPLDPTPFQELEYSIRNLGIPVSGDMAYSGFRAVTRLKAQTGVRVELDEGVESELPQKFAAGRLSLLDTQLWEYQESGFSWMANLWDMGLGGILADEMGVGKTLQMLALAAHVNKNKPSRKPILVILPNNLLLTWARETVRHAPKLAAITHLHSGAERAKDFRFLESQDLIFTTYSMVSQDIDFLSLIDWELVICDEAHWAKDPNSLRTQAVKQLRSRTFFLATGTPVQNRLLDLWNLIDIVDRGLLGSFESFQATCTDSPGEARMLGSLVEHRLLRRTQAQVGLEIPESIEKTIPLALSKDELATYKEIRSGVHPDFMGARGRGLIWPQRQFCAHTGFLSRARQQAAGEKSSYLVSEFEKIVARGEKAIGFVADCNEARVLYSELISDNFPDVFCAVIDGTTPQELRYGILERFKSHVGAGMLFLNPVVSGEGETIVEANHVFHLNPGWNPAKLDQSSFRVKRPGQVRTVFIHRLFYVDTLEEALMDLIESKREISEAALEAAQNRLDEDGLTKRLGLG